MTVAEESKKRLRPEIEEALAAMPDSETVAAPSPKKARTEERRSLFVRSLPPNVTNESLADFFSEYFPVKHATVVVDQQTKESRGFGFVTLADADDAKQAQTVFDKKHWEGRSIRVEVAEPRQRKEGSKVSKPRQKPGKPEFEPTPKLIVRNLPWSIRNSEQLGHLFRSYGKIKFADLPKNKGKLKGFGFVTLRGKKNAEKALEGINGKEIDGRTLAVDWAVDKNTWDQQQAEGDEEGSDGENDEETSSDEDSNAEDDENDDDDDDGESPGQDKEEGQLNADLENFMKNHMQNMVDEDDEEEDEEETKRKEDRNNSSDNSSTIFVRNLPFTTNDEQLKTFFSTFGNIRYARVVMDKATDRPAGTGFVCFFEEDDAKECIKGAPRGQQPAASGKKSILHDDNLDPTGKYTLDGRLLSIAQAVNRAEASNLAENSMAKRREKDKRRLYLLAEGSIGTNSPIYNLLSLPEIRMRQASAAQRKKLVQGNPTLHISLTRIALRNIPKNIGSKELKELARKAVVGFAQDVKEGIREPLSKEENARDGKDAKEKEKQRKSKGKGIVRQAKIVFESTQGSKVSEDSGAGKSRGYGFIEYVSHHWALMGLRYLNGHQMEDIEEGKKKRLVAEFAIENAQVVQRRRINEEKSRQAREDAANGKPRFNKDKDGEELNGSSRDEGIERSGRGGRGGGRGGRGGRGGSSGGRGGSDRRDRGDDQGHGGAARGGRGGARGRGGDRGGRGGRDGGEARERRDKKPLMDKFKRDGDESGRKGHMQQKLTARKHEVRKKKAESRGN